MRSSGSVAFAERQLEEGLLLGPLTEKSCSSLICSEPSSWAQLANNPVRAAFA